jgi:xyloglucan-specific exo-beta-1,4-glucanase
VPTGTMVRTVAVSPANRQRVLAGAEGWGMYASSDGGDTWQASYAGLEPNSSLDDIVFDPTNAQVVYCSDFRSGVYRSTDSGATWTKINQGLRNRTATDLSISADGQHLYVATDGEGVFRLDVSGAAPAAPYAVYLPLIVKRMG